MSKNVFSKTLTAKNLRESGAHREAINAWLYDARQGVGIKDSIKLRDALFECVLDLENSVLTPPSGPQECTDSAANTIAYVREILEK